MANYVLVHGGDRDGNLWSEVAPLLRRRHHVVYCPSMTSVKTATVQENVQEIVDYIRTQVTGNLILVGHSYGGFVVTAVADQLSERVDALIYLDALIPKPGKSLHELTQEYNFNYLDYGLTPDTAVMSPIHFNPARAFSRPIAYAFCLQGEFRALIQPIYEEMKKTSNCVSFCLDTTHACMLTQPQAVAAILLGFPQSLL